MKSQWESSFTKDDNIEQWCHFSEMDSLAKLLKEFMNEKTQKNRGLNPKHCSSCFLPDEVIVDDLTIRKSWPKLACMGESQMENKCWSKRKLSPISPLSVNIFVENSLLAWQNKCATFWKVRAPVYLAQKQTQHFWNSRSYQQSNLVVAVWWSGSPWEA